MENLNNSLQFISYPSKSLGHGSTLSLSDIIFYTENQTSSNFPFGKSEKDIINVGIYELSGEFVASTTIYSSGSYTTHTASYYDSFNQYNQYSYKKYNSDFFIVGSDQKSLLFDVSRCLNSIGVQDGNYKLYVELNRNIVGNEKQNGERLIINTISTGRQEITLIPQTLRGTDSEINREYDIFSNSRLQLKDVVEEISTNISNPQIYNIYNLVMESNPSGSAALKYNYGFKTDVDVINFLTDIYYGVSAGNYKSNRQIANNNILGIYNQFNNWMYQNYESGVTFQIIQDYYYSLFLFIVDRELNNITNKRPESFPQIVEFLQTIFYNEIFYPAIYEAELKRNIDLSGYFKYYLNFTNGQKISIINQKLIPTQDPRFYDYLALKIIDPLPQNFDLGAEAWITCDFGFLPIVQNLFYFSKVEIKTIPLRGPNFLVKIENEGNSTQALSMDELISVTGSAYNELAKKISSRENQLIDTTNYRNFENFVNFSSADIRLQAFGGKRKQIDSLYYEIDTINAKLVLNPNDAFYLKEKSDANSQIDELEAGMDGYERFLYENPGWYIKHGEGVDGYTSASFYDKNNGGSLINNLPQFIIEDASNNADYIKFVAMVGHFFDNISLTIKQLTEKNNYSSSPNFGISLDIVGDMLRSLGWDAEISKDNLPLILASFSKNDFDPESEFYSQARNLSEEQRNQIIWKRLLNSLPFIYKAKGTEASLNALISCFGVPKNIIKIKEYGGILNTSNLTDTTEHIVEEVKYEPYFSGSFEYFVLNWTGSAKTIEFNFRFDPAKTSESGTVFRLANCSDNWVVGAVRDRGNDWGKLFFSIDDGYGNVKTAVTSRAPIFDGNSYHAMVKRNDVDVHFNATINLDEYPTRYDLLLQKSEDDRITYSVTSSMFVSGSFNNSFGTGEYLYIGNYNQSTASLNIDPEAFFGNIDDIRVWETPLSTARFEAHTLHRNAYDLEDPMEMISDNLYRISFERPVDLYTTEPYAVNLNNLSFRKDFPTFGAANFPESFGKLERLSYCDPSEGPSFPYQFSRKDVRMIMKIPDYGSSKFRSNKINYVEQELSTDLSPDTRASYMTSELISTDSNKLGIFFSPSEMQNTEIIKFFGEFPLGDLIGDPASVYKNSYDKFERFRQIYYDQGFGNIDFTFFMNIVRFYFDKAMFKYIKGIIPARAKLVDGILIEPSILERPKLQLKPLVKENIDQKTGETYSKSKISVVKDPDRVGILGQEYRGIATYSDVNQVFFPAEQDQYGFEIYGNNGLTYYNGNYYRADVIPYTKKYQVSQKYVAPYSQLNENQIVNDFSGKTETITNTYYKVNIAKLPVVDRYPMTASVSPRGQSIPKTYFSGSLYFDAGMRGWQDYATTNSHKLMGIISGSVNGLDVVQYPYIDPIYGAITNGTIVNTGIIISGSMFQNGCPVTYSGYFDVDSGVQSFEGYIYGHFSGSFFAGNYSSSIYERTVYNIQFISEAPTSSIFSIFSTHGSGDLFAPLASGLNYRKIYSMEYYPTSSKLLNGYMETHHKYSKLQFSQKEINAYQTNPITKVQTNYKWKRSSQNKKTTVDPKTGLTDNTDAVIVKTI
jgi:hypothetical protein